MAQVEKSGFEITVVTGASGDGFDVTRELRHVKAALLYADRVRLVSPKMAMLEAAGRLLDGDEQERNHRLMRIAAEAFGDQRVRAALEVLQRKRGKDRHPTLIALDQQAHRRIASAVPQVEAAIAGFRSQPSVAEIYRARDAGVLALDGLGIEAAPLIIDSILARRQSRPLQPSRDFQSRLLQNMAREVAPARNTYPMFDDQIRELVRVMGSLLPNTQIDAKAAAEPHLATAFIARMESFPDARMDDLLDVRRELGGPLIHFRSAVAGMAREMSETPLDEEFGRAADALYREKVAPAILEIRELEEERGYRHQLLRQVTIGEAKPDIAGASIGAIGLAAATYGSLPFFAAAVAGAAGPGLSSVHNLIAAIARERDRLERSRQANKFLFLVEADRRLEHAHAGR